MLTLSKRWEIKNIDTLLHPGTRSCKSFIRSLIFSFLACRKQRKICLKPPKSVQTKKQSYVGTSIITLSARLWLSVALTSSCSNMNVIIYWFCLLFLLIHVCLRRPCFLFPITHFNYLLSLVSARACDSYAPDRRRRWWLLDSRKILRWKLRSSETARSPPC